MKIKYYIFIFSFIANICLAQQPTLEWVRTYNGSMNNTDIANAVTVDDSGNVYITGMINGNPPTIDICTIKYNSKGDSVWTRVFGQPGNNLESGFDLLVDSVGSVYVTGFPYTIKYNPNGNIMWLSNNNSGCLNILKDNFNNIVTLGALQNYYYVVSKYNASNGDSLYRTYIRAGNNPYDMAIDKQNNIYIAGIINGPFPPNYQDFGVVKCNSNGDSLWSWRYNGSDPQQPFDAAYGIAIDDSGYVYATGWSDNENGTSNYYTVKLTQNGDTVSTRRFNIGGSRAADIDVDKMGNIYVSGITNINQATLIKYLNDGTFQWSRTMQGSMLLGDRPYQTLDSSGNIYITSNSLNQPPGIQFAKYNSSGAQMWYVTYQGGDPKDIAVDKSNNVYVTGNYIGVDYITLKYSQPIGIQPISNEIPNSFKLYQNYPNPFNPSTKIKFQLKDAGLAQLVIYDILGRKVETLVNEVLKQGTYELDFYGSNYASGVYYYKLKSGFFSETKKMILIK